MSRLTPVNGGSINQQDADRADQLANIVADGGTAPTDIDAVLADLELRNLAQAVVFGSALDRYALGAAVGRLLCGGER